MFFRFYKNNFRVVIKIERYEIFVNIFCDRCCFFDRFCIVMKNFEFYFRCFQCVKNEKKCVNISWSSLNRTRKNLISKIFVNEAMLTIVIIKLLRNKNFLKEINAKTKRKTQCLFNDLKKSNIFKSNDCFVANVLIDFF